HSNLLSRSNGSFFFIAEIILDRELEYDQPFKADHCGTCTKCIDACPTDAITEPYVVDGLKCISYFTIELKMDYRLKWLVSLRIGCSVVTFVRMFAHGIDFQNNTLNHYLNHISIYWE